MPGEEGPPPDEVLAALRGELAGTVAALEQARLRSGKGEVLLTARPHQVDRRQQVSGETGYDQQCGDSEREGEPAGRAHIR